jgi:uridine kinase
MTQRMIIGIAGGTGAGKSTIASRLIRACPAAVSVVEHDAYYRDRADLDARQRAKVNYDHPDSLDNDLLFEHLTLLRRGQAIEKPVYDFVTHRRLPQTEPTEPRPVILVEGILIFAEPKLLDLMDLKIYVDTDADIRILRRIRRDMTQRGRTFDEVREQYYKTVRPMHLQFVEPSKRQADLIIPEGHHGNLDIALDIILERIKRVAGVS